ncbi:MAG: hypothetical protein WAK91_04635 [Candidatus Acidiferrales bacterium]|jgi:hypothetical protein
MTSLTNLRGFVHRHSLSIASIAILTLWLCLYVKSNPGTHLGSFFGNAIADWSGVVVIVFATKYLYEVHSKESRTPSKEELPPVLAFFRNHGLTIFLLVTGVAWVALYLRVDPNAKWGQVVGNIVSEWTQVLGTVVMTKHFLEPRAKL